MDECELDWNKVFKVILSDKNKLSESKNPCFQECVSEPNLNHCSKLETQKNESLAVNSRQFKSISDNKLSGNYHSKTISFQNKTLPEQILRTKCIHSEQKSKFVDRDNSVPLPEWNKVFKSILGKKSPTTDTQEEKKADYAVKKLEISQKDDSMCSLKKKVPQIPKMDPEEKKVRELFAYSRLFKLDYHNNINDFDGTGVDIFKCDKKLTNSFMKKSVSTTESMDGFHDQDSDSKSYLPLKGVVAIKPYKRGDTLGSPDMTFTEVWDDGFYF